MGAAIIAPPPPRIDDVEDPDRRRFLQTGLGAGAIVAAGSLARTAAATGSPGVTSTGTDAIPTRPLGRTGARVSILGLGGYHLGTVASVTDAIRLVHEAVDAGVTQPVSLTHPLAVLIVYWTVSVGASGVHTMQDFYELDPPLLSALNAPPR